MGGAAQGTRSPASTSPAQAEPSGNPTLLALPTWMRWLRLDTALFSIASTLGQRYALRRGHQFYLAVLRTASASPGPRAVGSSLLGFALKTCLFLRAHLQSQKQHRRRTCPLFLGKWHLGNFSPKPGLTKKNFVNEKWPVSHPGMHGFDEWLATEASASSSMPNCGCRREWVEEGDGCVIGGGEFVHDSFPCTNYWRQRPDNETFHLPCRTAQSTLACVTNLTSKIPGDDSMVILDRFEAFLNNRDLTRPFLALLHFQSVHPPCLNISTRTRHVWRSSRDYLGI